MGVPDSSSVRPAARATVIWARIAVTLIVLLALAIGAQWLRPRPTAPPAASAALAEGQALAGGGAPVEGHLAPDFEMRYADGRRVRLSDLRGQPVIINFWASWCPPCREEAPILQQFAARHAGGDVVLLGIDVWDKEPDARAFLAEFGLTYPNALDVEGSVSIEYGVSGVPETYVIGPDGRLLGKYTGPVESVDHLEAIVRELGGGL